MYNSIRYKLIVDTDHNPIYILDNVISGRSCELICQTNYICYDHLSAHICKFNNIYVFLKFNDDDSSCAGQHVSFSIFSSDCLTDLIIKIIKNETKILEYHLVKENKVTVHKNVSDVLNKIRIYF